jgi:hypothetical protein
VARRDVADRRGKEVRVLAGGQVAAGEGQDLGTAHALAGSPGSAGARNGPAAASLSSSSCSSETPVIKWTLSTIALLVDAVHLDFR